ncbi:MAG: mannose-1-phosphate guanylyltransferase [Cyclobacteriaceae bacterium]|nr:mannose-1-phosphate guanylyltransferase [Cyclobacteriaceae bacterium]
MNNHFYVVIMAGGIGSRFWPYSRNQNPKQFLDVLGVGSSLLQLTYQRFQSVCPRENIYIVTSENYFGIIKEQLPDLDDHQILLEPSRKNTAPCIAYASYKIAKNDPEATIVVTPSDHAILKEKIFIEAILKSLNHAKEKDILITLGIKPNRPETGYGYIQYHIDNGSEFKKVKTFTEKPQLDLAKKFVESGEFVWNAGIFIWNVKSIISAFEKFLPEISETFEHISQDFFKENEQASINMAYSQFKMISIDYGVMEKADNVFVILDDFGWSDLGSWNSLYEIRDKDANNNVIEANVLTYETTNSLILAEKNKLVVTYGLDGFLVADSGDVLLICKKDLENEFRTMIKDVRLNKGEKYI